MSVGSVLTLQHAAIEKYGQVILEDLQLSLSEREVMYLIGKASTGKSSLLQALYGELRVVRGEARVVGIDLRTLRWSGLPTLRRKLGLVFQDANLLMHLSVETNLRFVLQVTDWRDSKKIKARCEEVLQYVGLPTKAHKMPGELSGAERQRLAVARALLNGPALILADEPTGSLDPDGSEEVLALLHDLPRLTGAAVLIATHDYHTMEKFPAKVARVQSRTIISGQLLLD